MKRQLKNAEYSLSLKEINTIINSTDDFRDKVILQSLFWLGLRREEVIRLDIRDIDFQRKVINVLGKGKKIRSIPIINDDLFSNLKFLTKDRNSGTIFLSRLNKPLNLRRINYLVQECGEKAGVKNPNPVLKNINPHIFRHSLARYLKDKGYPVEFIQNMLGHSSFKTTMDMYGTMSLAEMQKVAERMKE